MRQAVSIARCKYTLQAQRIANINELFGKVYDREHRVLFDESLVTALSDMKFVAHADLGQLSHQHLQIQFSVANMALRFRQCATGKDTSAALKISPCPLWQASAFSSAWAHTGSPSDKSAPAARHIRPHAGPPQRSGPSLPCHRRRQVHRRRAL